MVMVVPVAPDPGVINTTGAANTGEVNVNTDKRGTMTTRRKTILRLLIKRPTILASFMAVRQDGPGTATKQ